MTLTFEKEDVYKNTSVLAFKTDSGEFRPLRS